jgi:hypothetical protein
MNFGKFNTGNRLQSVSMFVSDAWRIFEELTSFFRKPDLMPIAESTAAIVAAIIGAGTSAATTAASEIAKYPGSPVSATIVNESSVTFQIQSFAPTHGYTVESPATQLSGYFDEYQKFIAAATQEFKTNNPTDDNLEALVKTWSANDLFNLYNKGTNTTVTGTGWGMGFEGVYLLTTDTVPDVSSGKQVPQTYEIAILIRKIPGGYYGVGLGIANCKFYTTGDINSDPANIIYHLKNIFTAQCNYSDGGDSISVTAGNLKVQVGAPGASNKVVITEVAAA